VALLAIDGGPPKAYRVGEPVDGNLVLMRVTARSAVLGEAGVARQELSLQNAAPPAAAVGSLPTTPVMTPTLTQTLPGVAAAPGVAVPSLPLRQGPAPGPAALPQTPADTAEAVEEAGPRRPIPPPAR
jgi:general secretion pathway protein C